MRATAVPKKTKEDMEYCMCIWNAWWKERIASNETRDEVASEADKQIMALLQMNKEVMKHCLSLLNQARTGLWPAHAWFLEITLVRTSVCVCVCVCPPPRP